MRAMKGCLLTVLASSLLACCSGSNGTDGRNALVSVRTEEAGQNCASGGQVVLTGGDANHDGVLNEDEVSDTWYVCNGPTGVPALVKTAEEPIGEHCATGGTAIHSGLDANGNGVLDDEEISASNYVCNPTTTEPDLSDTTTESDLSDTTTETDTAPDAELTECTDDSTCEAGFACSEGRCLRDCGEDGSCPNGTFCNPEIGACTTKACSSDADCSVTERPRCDTDFFECREPLSLRAPAVANFRASPPLAVRNADTAITWVWDDPSNAFPLPVCVIDHGVGTVERGTVVSIHHTSVVPTMYTLTCTNEAGSDSATLLLGSVPSTLVTHSVDMTGGSFDFGVVRLDIPADALTETLELGGRFSENFVPSPDLVSLPFEMYPDGLHFNRPVTATLTVDTALFAAAGWNVTFGDLKLALGSGTEWQSRIMTTANPATHTLSATISHFTDVAATSSSSGTCDKAPLSSTRKSLVQRNEFLRLGGVGGYSNIYGQVYDDLQQNDRERMGDITDNLASTSDNGKLREADTGDLDGDGRDETVVLSTFQDSSGTKVLRWTVLDSCASTAEPEKCWSEMTRTKENDILIDANCGADLTVGDFDNDGRDELALIHCNAWSARLLVWDDATTNYQHLATLNLNDVADVHIVSGDMNANGNDGKEELAIAYTARNRGQYYVWESKVYRIEGTTLKTLGTRTGSTTSNYSRPNIDLGDADGDGSDDLYIARIQRNSGTGLAVALFELATDDGPLDEIVNWDYRLSAPAYWDSNASPLIQALDQSGDGRTEAWVVTPYFTTEGITKVWKQRALRLALGTAARPWVQSDNVLIEDMVWGARSYALASGDVDGDLHEELFSGELPTSGSTYTMTIWGSTDSDPKTTIQKKRWYPSSGNRRWDPVVAVGDFDGDSLALRYTGNCTTHESEQRPIVAMAAPPVDTNLMTQLRENSSTSYGTSQETGSSSSKSVSVSDTVTLSLEVEVLGGLFGASASTSLSREFNHTDTNSESVTMGQQTTASWSDAFHDNYIIYSVAQYTSYEYEIISAPDKAAVSDENRFMMIDVPQGSDTFSVTQTYYNAHAPANKQIGVETFSHSFGVPTSYHSYYECTKLTEVDPISKLKKGWLSNGSYVGMGLAANNQQITVTESNSTEDERSVGVEAEAGVSVAGVGLSYSRGYSSSNIYEVSIGNETSYQGDVGPIKDDTEWSAEKYKYWLAAYKMSRNDDSLKYAVIDYCVQKP